MTHTRFNPSPPTISWGKLHGHIDRTFGFATGDEGNASFTTKGNAELQRYLAHIAEGGVLSTIAFSVAMRFTFCRVEFSYYHTGVCCYRELALCRAVSP
ncbi:hypothetical protein [Thiothrix subterranea]|uniref:hypothetical protein n=1 Tax=Thiothrix subterranea TaxID=2735563 RepID=UPI00280B37DD|nr:hypothetical protein [Thiothrix subterranea]